MTTPLERLMTMSGADAVEVLGRVVDAMEEAEARGVDVLDVVMERSFVPLAPGVLGLATETAEVYELGGVKAVKEGSGMVGAFLDQLPRSKAVVVPFVTSERLAGMLARRGFVEVGEDGCWIRERTSRGLLLP